MTAFLYSPNGNLHLIPASDHWQRDNLFTVLSEANEVVCPSSVYISFNGRLLQPFEQNISLAINDVVRVQFRLPGGKGGFGSMLRAIGAQIEKTTSREACRDLSGRRMRDVNDEKKITEWVAKQADKERELARQKQERLERRRAMPKHNFDDRTYTKQIQENSEKIDDALKQGLKASTSASVSLVGVKRTSTASEEFSKKRKIWMDMDTEEFEDSDEDMPQSHRLADKPSTSTSTSTTSTTTSVTATKTDTSNESSSKDEMLQSNQTTESETVSKTLETGSLLPTSVEGKPTSEQEDKTTEKTKSDKECSKNKVSSVDMKAFNIEDYCTAEDLESLGLEPLKEQLKALGLKCGGTLQERAQRLFATKGKALEDLDPSLFAKPSKGNNKSKKK